MPVPQSRREAWGARLLFGGMLLVMLALIVSVTAGLARPLAGATEEPGCAEWPYAEFDAEWRPWLALEVARTPDERSMGLMFREYLDWDSGMLFEFEAPTRSGFWMRNTLVPLSIAWIDINGVIVDIQDMEPLTEDVHYPSSSYSFALEANQGWFQANGVEVGHSVFLCLPPPGELAE